MAKAAQHGLAAVRFARHQCGKVKLALALAAAEAQNRWAANGP